MAVFTNLTRWSPERLFGESEAVLRPWFLWMNIIYNISRSSSLSHVDSTNFLGSLTPPVPMIHHSCVREEPMYVNLCWSANTGVSICRSPEKNVTWVRSYLYSSTQHVLFVLLVWFMRWKAGGRIIAVLWSVAYRICSKQHIVFLINFHVAFS